MYFPAYHEKYLQGTNHVCVYLDNILVTGANEQEHLQNLDEVLHRLETAGMRLMYDNVPLCCLQLNVWATKFQLRVCSLLMTKFKQSTVLLYQQMFLSSSPFELSKLLP